ncbi:MAG: dihydropteroate synthase [Planctomycetota bacterium]
MTPAQIQHWLTNFVPGRSKPLVMGVLNVTPDSFSDGGKFDTIGSAVAQAERLIEDGADLLDIGGESTRPGSDPVDAAEQIRRTKPVIEAVRAKYEIALSIDTTRADVAAAALDAGACMLNDVAAGRDDASMLRLAAERAVPIVLMHMRGMPKTMQADPTYADVTAEVIDFLGERLNIARECGVGQILVDPGIGFGKTTEHNLQLLRDLRRFAELGPVLIGTSRKRFLGEITGETDPAARDHATTATTVWAALQGAAIIRVHNARAARHAVDVAAAIHAND